MTQAFIIMMRGKASRPRRVCMTYANKESLDLPDVVAVALIVQGQSCRGPVAAGAKTSALRIASQTHRGAASRRSETVRLATFTPGFLFLQVAEDGPGVHPQVARRLRPIAGVESQHLVDVLALPPLPGLGQREDGRELVGVDPQIFGSEQRLVGQHHGLLDPVLQLADVSRPAVPLDG